MISFGRKKLSDIIREPAKKQKIYIFLVCLFCSATFWVFTRLSGEIKTEVSQPIRIAGLPSSLMVVRQGDNSVQYTLETKGGRLFTSLFSLRKDTLRIGFSSLNQINGGDGETYFITSRSLSALISSNSRPGAVVSQVRPDSIFFSISGWSTKMVPVRHEIHATFERRFGLYGTISLTPDSVMISGPASIVDTLAFVSTQRLDLDNLNQSYSGQLNVALPAANHELKLTPFSVKVDVPVEEFTESQVEVQLAIDCPDSLSYADPGKLRLYPNRVSMVFLVALPDYQKLDAEMFHAYVVCPPAGFTGAQLQVLAGKVPDFVKMESIRPASVDFLIMN